MVDYTATARRPHWETLPEAIRNTVIEAIHASSGATASADVVQVRLATGGFTDGFAGIVSTGGHQAFVKAASSAASHIFSSYQREVEVLRILPGSVSAPTLIADRQVEVGADTWIALVLDAIDGEMPGQPWTTEQLASVEWACLQNDEALTPVPDTLKLDRMTEQWAPGLPQAQTFSLLASGEMSAPWLGIELGADNLRELHQLVQLAPEALRGESAVHNDLRADNILIDSGGAAHIVDWNWLAIGPTWTDWVYVLMQASANGVNVEDWFLTSPLTSQVPPEHIDSWYAALLGYMISTGSQEVSTSPFLQAHRQNEARSLARLLHQRLGW